MLKVRQLGVEAYTPVYQRMLAYTQERSASSPDELWFLQHQSVFTQGQAGKPEHVLFAGDIPVVQSDRGGQVTYHGPGQLVVYLLLNIQALGLGSHDFVKAIERALIACLKDLQIESCARDDAPGVYVQERKIASLRLRIKHGCSFHGIALNVDMNLEPFSRINPCGYAGMQMTQMRDETKLPLTLDAVAKSLENHLIAELKLQ